VKLLRTDRSGLVFQLGPREKLLLLETLELYPLVPASYHRLSQGGDVPHPDENQRLLEDALAEQRKENRRQVLAMLNESERFRATKAGFEFKLTHPEIEWLLQVLNDVRMGSWLALGEPEPGDEPAVTAANTNYHVALQVCGMFQSFLLAALGVSESPGWAGD
jgi:hypothetical protein